MASIQEIKSRIKAVTNTSQITKAMEMVSATKMRKSQEIALLSRPYALEVLRILGELSAHTDYEPAVMEKRDVKHTAVVVVASDRGLAGSFNTNVFRSFEKKLEEEIKGDSKNYTFIAVGKKAEEFLNRKGYSPNEAFKEFGDFVEAEQARPLSELLTQGFLDHKWDRVVVVSTHFRTTLRQDVIVRDVLPISNEKVKQAISELVPEGGRFSKTDESVMNFDEEKGNFEYLIEPDPKSVLDELAPELVAIVIYDLILEANASEHSARMVAMKNASENAGELKDELTLEFNKLRQAAITQEISEIVSGAESLNT